MFHRHIMLASMLSLLVISCQKRQRTPEESWQIAYPNERKMIQTIQAREKELKKKQAVANKLQQASQLAQKELFTLELELIKKRYNRFKTQFESLLDDKKALQHFIHSLPRGLFIEERQSLNAIISKEASLEKEAKHLLDKILMLITQINNVEQ